MGFWRKLGKIAAFAAPIAAAPFTGGASLALIGAGAGAANAALDHKGVKGMLTGAALGAVPGVGKAATAGKAMSGITKAAIQGGLGAAGGAATGGKNGALIGGLMGATSSKLGGSSSSGNANASTTKKLLDAGKNALIGNGNGQQGSLMQNLLSGNTLQAAGQGLGAVGQTQAHNRGVKLSAMMDADKMRMLNDQDRRAAESDIMRKLHQAAYIQSGGIDTSKPTVTASGKVLPKFDFGVHQSTPAEIEAAKTLEGQLMDRLKNPAQLADYSKQMDPSKMENFLNWTSPVLTTIAAAKGAGTYQAPTAANKPKVPAPTATPYTFGEALPMEAPPVVPGQLTAFGNTLDNNF